MEAKLPNAATPFVPAAAAPRSVIRLSLALSVVMAASGCESIRPYVPPSEGHISKPAAKPTPDQAIPPPARVTEFLPPPKPEVKPQTYSVVVNEVPVKDLLLALARDTKQNIDIHPGLTGLVSLNAINETLPAILERVSKQVNLRYRTEGNTIVVSPDAPYVKTYRVNYVDMQRDSTWQIGVAGQVGGSTGSGTQQTGAASASNTLVTTTMRSNFYQTLRENIKGILVTMRAQSQSAEERQRFREDQKLAIELEQQRLRAAQGAAAAASRESLGSGGVAQLLRAAQPGAPASRVEDDVILNAQGGSITVSATEREHLAIQHHLDSVLNAAQRQVLIEATIVEVQLSNSYQAGIDWARLSQSGGVTFQQQLLGANLANPPFLAFLFNQNDPATGRPRRGSDIQLTVRLLEQFGNTRVLSSPKLMALNNQTALLKVVDNIVYFEVQAQTTQAQTTAVTNFNTTAKTVAVGVVMGVTPQVNEDGRVSLTVRPSISRVLRFINDPNPALAAAGVVNAVPEVQTREMESVLQVGNGQTVVLGGLMQDDARRNRDQIPGADRLGIAGELFRFRDESVTKSELVIFLRPTVIANPTLESDELKFFQRFLPLPDASPQTPTPERAGAAR
jgi:MSHA type pilus biogenesis protein MshL